MANPTHHDPLEFLTSLVSALEQSVTNATDISGLKTRFIIALQSFFNLGGTLFFNNKFNFVGIGGAPGQPFQITEDANVVPPTISIQESSIGSFLNVQVGLTFVRQAMKDNNAPTPTTFITGIGTAFGLGQGVWCVKDNTGGVNLIAVSNTLADTETSLLLRRNVGGAFSLQRVSMGAADSGGVGFKLLRVPN